MKMNQLALKSLRRGEIQIGCEMWALKQTDIRRVKTE